MNAESLIDEYLEAITDTGYRVRYQVPPAKKRGKEKDPPEAPDVGPMIPPDSGGYYQGLA